MRAVVVEGLPAGFAAGAVFFGGEDGGWGEATLSDTTGETGFSTGSGCGCGADAGTSAGFGTDVGTGAGGSGDLALNSSLVSNALATIGALGFGGHSHFSLGSFAASPVCCDATLDERGGLQ